MLEFNQEAIEKELVPMLEKAEIEILKLAVAEVMPPPPLHMLGQLFGKIQKNVNEDKNPLDEIGQVFGIEGSIDLKPKKLLAIVFIRQKDLIIQNEPTLYQVVISESGNIQLTDTGCKDGTHYNSITYARNILEIPMFLENDDLFEECKCGNNKHRE